MRAKSGAALMLEASSPQFRLCVGERCRPVAVLNALTVAWRENFACCHSENEGNNKVGPAARRIAHGEQETKGRNERKLIAAVRDGSREPYRALSDTTTASTASGRAVRYCNRYIPYRYHTEVINSY